jgi:hypothetical protein
MSHQSFVDFLLAVRDDPALRARYDRRDLTRLTFHARNDGFDFTAEDAAFVVGTLEASVIVAKDRDPFDATSRLWRQMWGVQHLQYLVDSVVSRHSDDELRSLVGAR